MAEEDGDGGGAAGAGGIDEIEGADLRGGGFGDAADRRDQHDGEGQHLVEDAATEAAGDGDGEQHGRKGEEHVHGVLNGVFTPR